MSNFTIKRTEDSMAIAGRQKNNGIMTARESMRVVCRQQRTKSVMSTFDNKCLVWSNLADVLNRSVAWRKQFTTIRSDRSAFWLDASGKQRIKRRIIS